MPDYDYSCSRCGNTETKKHSMKDKPRFKCSACGEVMSKDISAPFLSFSSHPGRSEMMGDLKQNYGIESVGMIEGSFSDFYDGVKRDGSRVKEEMSAGAEKTRAAKNKQSSCLSRSRPVPSLKKIREGSQTRRAVS